MDYIVEIVDDSIDNPPTHCIVRGAESADDASYRALQYVRNQQYNTHPNRWGNGWYKCFTLFAGQDIQPAYTLQTPLVIDLREDRGGINGLSD